MCVHDTQNSVLKKIVLEIFHCVSISKLAFYNNDYDSSEDVFIDQYCKRFIVEIYFACQFFALINFCHPRHQIKFKHR